MEVERRVRDTKDVVRDHAASLRMLQLKMKTMDARAEDQENRNCRNNLRLVGLPEGAEGRDPAAYTEQMLHTLLPQEPFSPHFAVERAHRIPSVKGLGGSCDTKM